MLTRNSYQPKDGRFVRFFAQDEELECGCYAETYPVYSPNTAFLPFVFNLNLQTVAAFSVSVYHAHSGKRLFCLSSTQVPHRLYRVADGTHRFVYEGGKIPGMRMANGTPYYIEVLGFRSCVFVAAIELECLLKVTLANSTEVFGIPYHRGFRQWVWTDGRIGDFDYERYAVEEKDDLGRVTTLQTRLEKIWEVEFNDWPEPIYRTLAMAYVLDSVIVEQGVRLIQAAPKRASTALEKGQNCERSGVLRMPDYEVNETGGTCASDDTWEDVDNETGLNTCDADVWVDTGRFRCISNSDVGGCEKPLFSAVAQCENGAGKIVITPVNLPAGQTVEYSINDGSVYVEGNVFNGLSSDSYALRVRIVGTLCVSDRLDLVVNCYPNGVEWESSGIAFCVQMDDREPVWENTGESYCLAVQPATDDSLFPEIPLYPQDLNDLPI